MNVANILKETELAIAGLTKSEKKQLLKQLASDFDFNDVPAGIEKKPNVMNGIACIRKTRIPVWLLQQARTQGVNEAELLRNYPGMTAEDLVNAWSYVESNRSEIEDQIAKNELDD